MKKAAKILAVKKSLIESIAERREKSMLICKICNELFDQLIPLAEPHGETLYHSPCGCGEWEDAKQCLCCGEEIAESELFNGFCQNCIETAKQGFTREFGLAFIIYGIKDEYKRFATECEFYIDYAAGISNHDCDTALLLDMFKKTPDVFIVDFDHKLKTYCFDNLGDWAEFYFSKGQIAPEDNFKVAIKGVA